MTKQTSRTRQLFNLLFPVACCYVFAYPIWRLSDWFDVAGDIGFLGAAALWVIGLGGMYCSFSGPKMRLRYIVVHWMGASFVLATVVLFAELIRVLTIYSDNTIAWATVIVWIGLLVFAIASAHALAVKRQQIPSSKVTRRYRLAQISDVHIGSRQAGFMRRIVNRLNHLKPDCVLITGDLIDSSAVDFEALESLSNIEAKTFFTIGNHERYADLEKILDIAKRLNITTLRQQSITHGELAISGIDDADSHDQVRRHLPDIDREKGHFNILMYHRPQGWECAIEHGIDLMLSGHTHNGQIFPFNLIVKQQFKRICGLYRKENQYLYVSSGTGTWGPLMRLGTRNEISVFDIHPE